MQNEKCLFVVSGPAGVGKDSVVKTMRDAHPEIEKTVSATTRKPRPGEQEGVSYYYRSVDEFKKMLKNSDILESNFYCGNYYGTPRAEVEKRLADGKIVVLVIDVHGAANLKHLYPDSTTVFICPPSVEELEARLRGRGTEDEETIANRMITARSELALASTYDARIVNDDLAACAEQLYQLICQRAK